MWVGRQGPAVTGIPQEEWNRETEGHRHALTGPASALMFTGLSFDTIAAWRHTRIVRGTGTSMDFACAEVRSQSSQGRMDITCLLLPFEPPVWRRVFWVTWLVCGTCLPKEDYSRTAAGCPGRVLLISATKILCRWDKAPATQLTTPVRPTTWGAPEKATRTNCYSMYALAICKNGFPFLLIFERQ